MGRRLQTLILRAKGIKRNSKNNRLFRFTHNRTNLYIYITKGITGIINLNYGGNHRNISYEEESKLLEPFIKKSELGQIVEVSEILNAYEKKL